MTRIRYITECPYCGEYAKRVCYGYDGNEKYIIYLCQSCKRSFTMVIKKKNGKGRFRYK